jgi:Ca2+-binding EF-hand superfamily protein
MVSSCNRCLKKSFQWFYAAGNINHNSFKQILKVIKGYHPVVYILF